MTDDQKERLLEVAARLRSEAIRREHEMGEALMRDDWFKLRQHQVMSKTLYEQADAIMAALR